MNHLLRTTALLGLAAALAVRLTGEEHNAWPVRVTQIDAAGTPRSWMSAGPFWFEKPAEGGGTVSGLRPFFVRTANTGGELREATVLYPLYLYRQDSEVYSWSIFQLINRSGPRAGTVTAPNEGAGREALDVWPFWFSRDTGSPETSYRALFPVAGTLKHRLGYDRLAWTLFPLYAQAEKHGATTTLTPWPFIRTTRGTEQGFAFWPLFGWRDKPGEFHHQYYLWPLIWNHTRQPEPDAPANTAPARQAGFLPFYTSSTRPGFVDKNFVWPFFGYTERTVPYRYHETRYLWPFAVQGRGDARYVNRWGPFYTHSIMKGVDKTWVLWPAWRQSEWTDDAIAQTKTQFLFFLYWSLEQRSTTNPAAAPAEKTHLWPLFSAWDNGAGRRQFQLFSPLEVFFPSNRQVREAWTPLFALYRSEQRDPGYSRHELLWGAVTWRRTPTQREFHLGPLFSVESRPAGRRIALGNGLLGLKRSPATGGWRFFWFDFSSKPDDAPSTPR
jgi:hypothetical protein